uniref:DUF659 domain-containing protein n=1 Tax=Schizaphis graminum TaxID=13262 RepID=A0A2S2PMY2_SCHGA
MPKISSSLKSLFAQWISSYNNQQKIFMTDGATIFCQVCDRNIPCTKKSQLTQHIHTAVHKNGLKRKLNTSSKQLFLSEATPNENNLNNFNKDLCLALVAANIPWYKMQVPQFHTFLEKYTDKHYFEPCYHNTLTKIKNETGENNIWIAVDETTDLNGRYIANLLVRILKSNTQTCPFLLTCKVLEKTNHSTVARIINDGLKLLWLLGGNDEKVLLMLSDTAPYMTKTGDTLKVFYPNLIHVTCVAHIMNRVAENVRKMLTN